MQDKRARSRAQAGSRELLVKRRMDGAGQASAQSRSQSDNAEGKNSGGHDSLSNKVTAGAHATQSAMPVNVGQTESVPQWRVALRREPNRLSDDSHSQPCKMAHGPES